MKNRFVSSVLATSLLVVLSVALAHAESVARFSVTVPFAFTAGNVAYPSGDYTISKTNFDGVLEIQNKQGNQTSFILTTQGGSYRDDGKASIQFHRYADQYFLFQVSQGLGFDWRKVPVSHLEKEYIVAARTVASNSLQPEVVAVATH